MPACMNERALALTNKKKGDHMAGTSPMHACMHARTHILAVPGRRDLLSSPPFFRSHRMAAASIYQLASSCLRRRPVRSWIGGSSSPLLNNALPCTCTRQMRLDAAAKRGLAVPGQAYHHQATLQSPVTYSRSTSVLLEPATPRQS